MAGIPSIGAVDMIGDPTAWMLLVFDRTENFLWLNREILHRHTPKTYSKDILQRHTPKTYSGDILWGILQEHTLAKWGRFSRGWFLI